MAEPVSGPIVIYVNDKAVAAFVECEDGADMFIYQFRKTYPASLVPLKIVDHRQSPPVIYENDKAFWRERLPSLDLAVHAREMHT